MVDVVLTKDHRIGSKVHLAGDTLEVSEFDAKWLEQNQIGSGAPRQSQKKTIDTVDEPKK